MMLAVCAITLVLVMLMAMIRAFAGPTFFDRVLAVNLFGTKTVLLISVLGFLFGRPEFLDIALVYALMNFISVIALLRYVEYSEGKDAS
ncbi:MULTISPECIES: monovalent cation/H+ antiporter complex subunit F [Spongiibacter]|uniref:monovalent cation/H+ antiporter complex subunit F n=2 Tax=Spongiibacteraceae TaxID=1706375 RepID=UPI000491450B|nr:MULTISPECIES: monovalent cation/H+ antiporter complex subunit F [Spongiibacter]MAY40554.1 pH regulation protein F [Spongiibacter sp.]MBO6753488.1 pH regulation protein F [Spongiibacter sp.]MBU72718.1 pH regulation protein F [Spongiibacter sp.]|tara:strand:+ start:8628 stop:8894 length:267 start_codon:yes stop_codon:yes gene_type:complete